ncbi:MAG TPA: NUDIX domain-containing protein, partial [Thermoplasmata archaeon]|nr:NUDIX domain-containing protein [Thermoplasmata archaeon]
MAELGDRARKVSPAVDRWLSRWPPSDLPHGTAGAAVTIVLREGHKDVEALLIERAVREEDPASGHVALPGGREDADDATTRTTALRELREEVGLGPTDLVGTPGLVGVEVASMFGLRVAVFAAALGPATAPKPASPSEVAHVFWLPESALDRVETVERDTKFGIRKVPAVVHQG